VTNPTPINIGFAQEITYSEKATLKSLYGTSKRALAVAGGTIKSSIKVKAARISLKALNAAYYGGTLNTGMIVSVIGGYTPGTVATAIPATPFTITPVLPTAYGTGTWVADRGVVNATTGLPMTAVTGTPNAGQYSVAAGVYTFSSADHSSGYSVLISSDFSETTVGQSILVANQPLGQIVSVGAVITALDPTTNLQASLQIFNIAFTSLDLGTKPEDFEMPDLEGECFVNAAGNIYQWNIPDQF
jgi:hypothetical protein